MKDSICSLDFENIWHEASDTLVIESSETFSNATTPSTSNESTGPTPDDLADGTWRG